MASSTTLKLVFSDQPDTATLPPRASMPTAILPGCFLAAAFTKSGSRTAAVPRITRATPSPEPGLDRAEAADAAAELNGNLHRLQDRRDRERVHRLAGESAVEIDEMQPFEAECGERAGLRRRIAVEHGGARHVALLQAHGFAVLQVDRGKKDHGFQRRKFASNARPSFWLFSGWNWVPAMLSRATIAVSGPP